MSRTFKKIPPSLKVGDKNEWQVDEKGIKTAEQRRGAHLSNRRDRHQAKNAAANGESLDFQPHHSATSGYTRSFG